MAGSSQRLRRWLLYPAASLVIGLAVLVGVLRLLLPVAPRYQAEIRSWASRATGLDIGFRTLSASWPLAGPALSLYGVTMADHVTHEPIIRADELTVGLSLWRIARDRNVLPARLRLSGSRLAVERSADGRLTVQGHDLFDLIKPRPDRHPDVELAFEKLRIDFNDRRSPRTLTFGVEEAQIGIRPFDFTLAAALRLPAEYGGGVNIAVGVPGGLFVPGGGLRRPATWKAGFSGADIDVVRVLELLLDDHRPLVAARGSLLAGLAFSSGRLEALSVDANLHDVSFGPGAASGNWQRLAGVFAWNRRGAGWDAVARQFVIRRGDRAWPVSNGEVHFRVATDRSPAEWHAGARFLRLEDVYPLVQSLAAETELADQLPQSVHGDIRDLQAMSAADPESPTRFSMQLRFDQLGYVDHAGAIAIAGLTGSLRADGDGGRLQLDCKGASLGFNEWFDDTRTADTLKGQLAWSGGPDGFHVEGDDIRFKTAGISISSRLKLDFPADRSSPLIDMRATATARNTREVLRYLPLRKFPPRTGAWLERAILGGELSEVTLDLRGPLQKFPFARDAGPGAGVFHVDMGLKDATLDYADNWPRVEHLTGHVVFDGVTLSSSQNHSRVGALEVTDFDVRIPDLRHGVLEINGRTQTSLANVLEFLRQTPVADSLGPTFARVTASGPVASQIRLSLPLANPHDYDLQVETDTQSATLGLVGVPVTLDKLRGHVRLHNKQFSGEGVTGELLGEPVIAGIAPEADEHSPWTHTADLRGGADVARLMEAFHLPFRDQFSGHVDYTATAFFPSRHAATQEPFLLAVRSDLHGVVSTLPRPFAKRAEVEWPANVALRFPKDGVIEINGQLQPPLAVALRLVNVSESGAPAPATALPAWRIERGTINVASAPAVLPAQTGIELGGGLAELRIADWIRFIAKETETAPEAAEIGTVPIAMYRSATFGVGRLEVADIVFRDAFVNARRTPLNWVIDVEGPEAIGRVTVPRDLKAGAPISLDMERLWLLERDDGVPGVAMDPRTLPGLDIRVEDTAFGKWHIGGVQATIAKTADGLVANPIAVHGTSFGASGDGTWRVNPERPEEQQSELRLSADSSDVEDTLEQLGFDKILSGKSAKLKADISWPGGPSAQFMEEASGTLKVEINKGQVLDIEPGTGRLLGLLSVAALPRRLSLDFRDVFNKGLAFDTIKGDFRLASGDAYTCNLGVEGPTADMGIIGRTGFAAQDYDQLAVVRPQVSNVLPIVGASVLGGPIGGVTMLLISQVFRKSLSTLGESYYRVSGPWEKPAVDRVERKQVDTARFKDCEKELAETLKNLPVPPEFPPSAEPVSPVQ